MGWGLRFLAISAGIVTLGLGAWPISLLAAAYLAFSFRKPRAGRATVVLHDVGTKPGRPWGRYGLGVVLLLFAGIAVGVGGTISPVIFFLGGLLVISLPHLRPSFVDEVVPMRESILLRSRLLPFRWYALAEVKLESQDQPRGVAAMDGRILVFAGKVPSAVQVLSAYSFGHRNAEEKVVRALRRETRMLSQRGTHLLPLDSADAYQMLSVRLKRVKLGTDDLGAVSSLPFDIFALQAKDGLVVSRRVFRIEDPSGRASIPTADRSPGREPLFAEVVEKIGERHGWPEPDEFSPFLAAMDASRAEPLVDRFRARGEEGGKVAVETPGGAEARLTRAQLRAVARIYA